MSSFFNYVDPSEYDITEEDMLRCCYDEVVAEFTDTGDIAMCGEKFLQDAARFKLADFKDWMRPLFYDRQRVGISWARVGDPRGTCPLCVETSNYVRPIRHLDRDSLPPFGAGTPIIKESHRSNLQKWVRAF